MTCFDDPGSILIHSDWMTGKPFRSIVVAVERCVPNDEIICASEAEVDDFFDNHPIKVKTGYLKFARNIYGDSKNIDDYIYSDYSQEYVPISTSFVDMSTSFLNQEIYKKPHYVMVDEIAFD